MIFPQQMNLIVGSLCGIEPSFSGAVGAMSRTARVFVIRPEQLSNTSPAKQAAQAVQNKAQAICTLLNPLYTALRKNNIDIVEPWRCRHRQSIHCHIRMIDIDNSSPLGSNL
jgi:hypothetical protein